jgi:hypothetical protein
MRTRLDVRLSWYALSHYLRTVLRDAIMRPREQIKD